MLWLLALSLLASLKLQPDAVYGPLEYVVTNVSRLGTRSLDDSGRMGLAGSIFASGTDDATADPATESIDARMASASETQSQTRRKDFLPSGTQRRPERASPARPLAQEGRLHTKSTLASTRNPRSDAMLRKKANEMCHEITTF